jgi:hypothetical protein
MRVQTSIKYEHIERTDTDPAGLAWVLAAVLTVSIGAPLVAGAFLRYFG